MCLGPPVLRVDPLPQPVLEESLAEIPVEPEMETLDVFEPMMAGSSVGREMANGNGGW